MAVVLYVFSLLVGIFWSIPIILSIIWTFITSPLSCCKARKYREYPRILTDERWGEHGYVHANGQKFHYVSKGSGPLLLCVHGFPEFWFSWRHQLEHLSDSFRVVAIDLRGYGESSKPGATFLGGSCYSSDKLCTDILGIINALGQQSCTLLAHDWGGALAWQFAATHPTAVDRLIVCNCPHSRGFMKNMTFSQFRRSWYMFFFQLPILPEVVLSMQDFYAIGTMFVGRTVGVRLTKLSPAEIDAYIWAFSQPGVVTCAINYYRNLFTSRSGPPNVKCPTLVLWGDKDGALEQNLLTGTEKYVPDLTIEVVPGASHWVQMDAWETVNNAVRRFASGDGARRGK